MKKSRNRFSVDLEDAIREEGSMRLQSTFRKNQIEMLCNTLLLEQIVPSRLKQYTDIVKFMSVDLIRDLPYRITNAGVKTYSELLTLVRDVYQAPYEITTAKEYWDVFEETVNEIAEEMLRYDKDLHETNSYLNSKLQPININELELLQEQVEDQKIEILEFKDLK